MKSLSYVISESLTVKQSDIIADVILRMFNNTKSLTIGTAEEMLNGLDLDIIQKIENSIYKSNKKEFLPYYNDNDDFLKAKSDVAFKDSIIKQLADFLVNIFIKKV